jgi:hypothetical protein
VRFAFIDDQRGQFPVELLCEVLGVSCSGYYAWRNRPPSPTATRRAELVERIRGAHRESRATYGSPRVYRELEARGVACCENTVAKLMRENGIRSKARRRFVPRTTDGRHDRPVAGNVLAREFYPDRPDAAWAAEIVHSQMTKPAGLAGRPDRERIPDLDVVPGHHDPVDQQLDQLSLPLERGHVETHPHSCGEPMGGVRGLAQVVRPARFSGERPFLGRQHLVAAFQFLPPPLILAQPEDPTEVGFGEPLDLLSQARSSTPQVLATGP